MRRIDLIKFNAELLQKMQSCGIKLNDWQYVNLYNDYEEMLASGTKKTAIALILAEMLKICIVENNCLTLQAENSKF